MHILPKLHAIDFSNSTSVEVLVGDQDHAPLIDLVVKSLLGFSSSENTQATPYVRLRALAKASKLPVYLVVRISREYYEKYGATIPEVVGAWAELQASMLWPKSQRSTLFLVIEEYEEKNS